MSNRTWKNRSFWGDPDPVTLYAVIAFNATGTPTLLQVNPQTGAYTAATSVGIHGVKSVARTGTGLYTITLQDSFVRVLETDCSFISSTNPVATSMSVKTTSDPTNGQAFGTAVGCCPVRTGGTSAIAVVFCSSANTPADPAATEIGIIKFVLQNGSTN